MLPPPPERWQAGSMTGRHGITLTTITLGASEPRRLAEFSSRLLDWPLEEGDETWVAVRDPAMITVVTGGGSVCFAHGGSVNPRTEQLTLHMDDPNNVGNRPPRP